MRLKYLQELHNLSSIYVNTEKKWIWIRIHKTAGTSMYDRFLVKHCWNISKQKDQITNWLSNITNEELKDYFIWSFVRNPYDRFVSIASMFDLDANYLARNFHQLRIKQNIIKRHSESQSMFTHHQGIPMIDWVGSFENLEYDWDTILARLDLPKFTLPKLNTSKHDHFTKVLNSYGKDFFKRYYKLDFENFGYEK